MSNDIETISESRCFGDVQGVYGHRGVDLAGESECPLWVRSGHTSVLATA